MKTKLYLIILLLIVVLVCCAMCLTACEHKHSFNTLIPEKPATCTEDGNIQYYVCSCGEYGLTYTDWIFVREYAVSKEEVIVKALGHAAVIDEAVEPTCAETGLTEGKHCSRCNDIIEEQKVVEKIPHNIKLVEERTPSCTEEGNILYWECCDCGECITSIDYAEDGSIKSYTYILKEDTTIQALGHTEVIDKVKNPTCTKTGLTGGKHCSVCNAILEEQKIVDKIPHDEELIEEKAPTCTMDGYKLYICKVCQNHNTEVIPATGHNEVNFGNYKAPTCTVEGLDYGVKCSVCDEVLKEQAPIALIPHNRGEWTVAVYPTCNEDGYEFSTCSVCGQEERGTLNAIGHDYSTAWTWIGYNIAIVDIVCNNDNSHKLSLEGTITSTSVLPTCQNTGRKDYLAKAEHDGKTYVDKAIEVLEKIPHNFVISNTSADKHTCTMCNEFFNHDYADGIVVQQSTCTENGGMEYTCKGCQNVKTEVIPATGHNEVNFGNYKAPTCTVKGLDYGVKCSVCDEVLKEQEPIALIPHNRGEWMVAVYPTCNEEGYEISTCSVCGQEERRTLNPLGHDYSAEWKWNGYDVAVVELVCSNDSSHKFTLEGIITRTVVSPTCQRTGTATYTAKVVYEGKTYTDKTTELLDVIPHNFVESSTDVDKHICTLCKEKGNHEDNEYTGSCVICGKFFEEIKEIRTKFDFMNIAEDLSASYVLRNDIELDGSWASAGLGSLDNPFTGKLYGNGHVISNLNYEGGKTPNALFVSNKGLIDGLTLRDISIKMYSGSTGNVTLIYGGIAAYNYGTISNCKIDGKNKMDATNGWNLKDNICTNWTFIGGAISGINYGTIEDCEVSGIMNNYFSTFCYSFHDGFIAPLSQTCRVTSNIYFGNVAGRNEGEIINTNVNANQQITMFSKSTSQVGADKSYATLNCYAGSLVAENKSNITNCSAKAYTETHSTEIGNSSSCSASINIKKESQYEGIIGVNKGKITNFNVIY